MRAVAGKIFDQIQILTIAFLMVTLLLLLYPVFLIFVLIRLIVEILAKIFRPNLLGCLNAIHAIFAMGYSKEQALENFVVAAILSGNLSLEQIQESVKTRIFENPENLEKFSLLKKTWKYFLGYAFWVEDENFNVVNHIRDYDYSDQRDLYLPRPCTDKNIHGILAKLFQVPWNRKRSPWEFLRVSDVFYEGKDCTALIMRMDHALGDGYSIMDLMRNITGSKFEVPEIKMAERKLKFWEKICLLGKIPYDVAVNIRPALRTRGIKEKRPGFLVYEEVVSISDYVDVNTVKKIKAHFQVNFATVLYTAICGAIEKALKVSGEKVPENIMGGSVVPIPNHPGGICIHVTTAPLELPIKRENPLERMKKIQEDLMKLSQSTAIFAYRRASRRAGFAPTVLGRLSPIGAYSIGKILGFGVMLTNFPVYKSLDFFEGHEFLDMTMGVPTVIPCGIFVSIGGANNKLRFNFNVRRNLFASDEICQNMGKYVMEELHSLLEMTV